VKLFRALTDVSLVRCINLCTWLWLVVCNNSAVQVASVDSLMHWSCCYECLSCSSEIQGEVRYLEIEMALKVYT